MKADKRLRLTKAGWRIGSAAEFLGLSAEEESLVEMRLNLSKYLKDRREREGLTQTDLAGKIHSSQSRVAKMEAGDPGISLDLLLRAILATGATQRDIGRAISR